MTINLDTRFFVFDVESVGLWGEAFAWGYVLIDCYGTEYVSHYMACPLEAARGSEEGREWVTRNVLPSLPPMTRGALPQFLADNVMPSPAILAQQFLSHWQGHKDKWPGMLTVCDCPFPVETNFLRSVAEYASLGWSPYPLIDVASVLLTVGDDPIGVYPRAPNELPAHNPVNDARQSARLLLAGLSAFGGPIGAVSPAEASGALDGGGPA